MIIAADIFLSIILMCAGYVYVSFYLAKERDSESKWAVLKPSTGKILYLVFAMLTVAALVTVFNVIYGLKLLPQIKLLTLVLIILPASAIDFKVQRIPNKLMLAAVIIRAIIYGAEVLITPVMALSVLKDSVVGALVIGLFFLLLLLLFKNSLGMGDVKLFAVMGLFQGLWGVVNAVFFSLVVSFFVSVTLLITKKKGRKDTISFAPSILLGTIVAMIMAGM